MSRGKQKVSGQSSEVPAPSEEIPKWMEETTALQLREVRPGFPYATNRKEYEVVGFNGEGAELDYNYGGRHRVKANQYQHMREVAERIRAKAGHDVEVRPGLLERTASPREVGYRAGEEAKRRHDSAQRRLLRRE